jgi:hypothetical protein
MKNSLSNKACARTCQLQSSAVFFRRKYLRLYNSVFIIDKTVHSLTLQSVILLLFRNASPSKSIILTSRKAGWKRVKHGIKLDWFNLARVKVYDVALEYCFINAFEPYFPL